MSLVEQAQTLQHLLVAQATGGSESESDYLELCQVFTTTPRFKGIVPPFVTNCRSLSQFWQFIKYKYPTYRERRDFIWSSFAPLVQAIEETNRAPSDSGVADQLKSFDAAALQAAWSKALDRRNSDPEGAITAARTLLESTCKHILDELQQTYDDSADLPKLYSETAKALKLSPSQHTEDIFKQVLSGCVSVVNGLGALRNRLSDAHGKGKYAVKPAPRHAEFAVNLAGTMATFLLATLQSRRGSSK